MTGGTSGLGRESVLALAKHSPEHIYFTGRNAKAAETLIAEVNKNSGTDTNVPMTFLELDMASLPIVKQSKLANIVYVRELARQHPEITAVSIHPGVVETDLVTGLDAVKKTTVYASNFVLGTSMLTPQQVCLNQVWAAAGAKIEELVNGGYYMPVGVLSNGKLDKVATSPEVAKRLWDWTDDVLKKF